MSTGATPAIRCRGVTKRFGHVTALDQLDLSVPEGAVVGFLGPNGAGKSTTIRILLDLARPDAGEVEVLGHDPRTGGPALRRRIGYVPGELRLDDRIDVGETLRSWARIRGDVDPAYVDELCQRLSLDPTRATSALSSGNRRKVGLVGAFMARPELLILDEPTSGIDPLVQIEVLDLINEVRAEGRTVFLSSHSLSDVQRVADEVVVIRDGRTVGGGDLDELRRSTRQEFVVWFAASPPVDALHDLPSVSDLEIRDREVRGTIVGDPNPLLRLLAEHPVAHVVLPEPELEEAFLRLYGGGDR